MSIQVLGYYNRRGINPEAFLSEIKYIASDPDDGHFFNVTDEAALKDIVDALGDRIFSLEGAGLKLQRPAAAHVLHCKTANYELFILCNAVNLTEANLLCFHSSFEQADNPVL